MQGKVFPYHYDEVVSVDASAENIFSYLDDHTRLSSHMGKSSWMMGGGSMKTEIDEGRGQRAGSHIKLFGKAFGMTIFLDEVVTRHEPPKFKEWETVGTPKLLIVGQYRMGVEITPRAGNADLQVFIDYDLPDKNRWLGRLFARTYAKWCVRQMLYDVRDHFNIKSRAQLK